LVQFDLNSIPSNSTVLSAQLAMRRNSTISSSPQSVDLYPLTHWWTGGTTWGTGLPEVSWNRYDGASSWNTSGGDYQSPATWTTTVASQIGFYTWSLTNLVQSWVNGQTPNDGVLLKESDETVNNIAQFDSSFATDPSKWPYLSVRWYPLLGAPAWNTFVKHQLNDRMDLGINVANGNLLIHERDLSIQGTGMNEVLDRYYNELCPYRWDLGVCWSMGTGADVILNPNDGDGVTYYGPGQYGVHFIKNSDGSYASPAGIDATLTFSNNAYQLSFHATSEQYNFDGNGYLTSDVDRNGNQLLFAYNGNGALSSITDTQARVTTLAYNSGVELPGPQSGPNPVSV
jgi:YD repeat-containing protein